MGAYRIPNPSVCNATACFASLSSTLFRLRDTSAIAGRYLVPDVAVATVLHHSHRDSPSALMCVHALLTWQNLEHRRLPSNFEQTRLACEHSQHCCILLFHQMAMNCTVNLLLLPIPEANMPLRHQAGPGRRGGRGGDVQRAAVLPEGPGHHLPHGRHAACLPRLRLPG